MNEQYSLKYFALKKILLYSLVKIVCRKSITDSRKFDGNKKDAGSKTFEDNSDTGSVMSNFR